MEHPNYTYNLDQQTAGVHPGSSSPWRHLARAEETFSWGGGGCVSQGALAVHLHRGKDIYNYLLLFLSHFFEFIALFFVKNFTVTKIGFLLIKIHNLLWFTPVFWIKNYYLRYIIHVWIHIPSMILVKVIPVLRIHISRNAQHKCRIRMQILPQFWLYK